MPFDRGLQGGSGKSGSSARRASPAFSGVRREPVQGSVERDPIRNDAQRKPASDSAEREQVPWRLSRALTNSQQAVNAPGGSSKQSSRGSAFNGPKREKVTSESNGKGLGTPHFDGPRREEIPSKLSGRIEPAFDGPDREDIESEVSRLKRSSERPQSRRSSRPLSKNSSPKQSVPQLHEANQNDSSQQYARNHREDDLITRRLRQAYGHGISELEIKHICRMDLKNGERRVEPGVMKFTWQKDSKGITKNVILGRDVKAVSGQVVRHVGGGKRPPGQFDGDYLSGGDTGTVTDVSGDYAQVRWANGNVRFYYVGATPWRKDPNGEDTDNPRALRCLVLVQ